MDPFSVALGTLSIAEVALMSINGLIRDINAIRDAPDVITNLRNELEAVNAILITLEHARQNSKLEVLTLNTKSALHLAIENCKRACDKFGMKLKRWTKHSDDENVHWWDRVRIGLFAEATIKSLDAQLNRCKSTVNIAVSTAILLTSPTSNSITDVMQTRHEKEENEISEEISKIDEEYSKIDEYSKIGEEYSRIDEQNTVVKMAIQNANTLRPRDDGNDSSGLSEQLQYQRAALDASRELLEDLWSKVHHARTGQNISKINMREGGKLLVGLMNCDGGDGEVRQDIHDVMATNHGKGVVGIAKGLDYQSFFKD